MERGKKTEKGNLALMFLIRERLQIKVPLIFKKM